VITIHCPPGGDPEKATFTAQVYYSDPDTTVLGCALVITPAPPPPLPPPIDGVRKTPQSNPGEWDFTFTAVPVGTYNLLASGDKTGPATNAGITITSNATDPCATFIAWRPVDDSTPKDATRLKGVSFTGARPLDADGNPMPLTLAGLVPATFTIGGPLPPFGKPPKITLAREDETESDISKVSATAVEVAGGRWYKTFLDMQEGTYLFTVEADCESIDTLELIITADIPDDILASSMSSRA
jgi:hypothetical protein